MQSPCESDDATVLLIDDHESFCASLGRSFSSLGFTVWQASDYPAAGLIAEEHMPSLIVTELRLNGAWAFDWIGHFRQNCARGRVAIATIYPSVATAVRSVRLGFDGYFTKPVQARDILNVTADDSPSWSLERPDPCLWPSLDRTIWEYINQVFVAAGTMSEAARRLGIDRRSLRRMLAKYPPAR